MRAVFLITIVALAAALTLPRVAATAYTAIGQPAVASVQAQDHPETLDEPHPAGVTETPSGAAAAECEIPTGSPGIAGGDLSVGPQGADGATAVVAGGPAETISVPSPEHPEAVDAPHPVGETETPYGTAATACGQEP
ncbi:MAG TPA: hypothetical protein VFE37_11505 [Chloroflexota bacterium]|nr:hypothetical protein [Chloroflexota bacterium]